MTPSTDTATYVVTGMTCGHCVSSVTEEVGELTGVTDVAVTLDDGRLVVTGTATEQDVRGAVEAAGYQLS